MEIPTIRQIDIPQPSIDWHTYKIIATQIQYMYVSSQCPTEHHRLDVRSGASPAPRATPAVMSVVPYTRSKDIYKFVNMREQYPTSYSGPTCHSTQWDQDADHTKNESRHFSTICFFLSGTFPHITWKNCSHIQFLHIVAMNSWFQTDL